MCCIFSFIILFWPLPRHAPISSLPVSSPSPVTKLFFSLSLFSFCHCPLKPLTCFSPPLPQIDEADFSSFCQWVEDLPEEGMHPYLQGVVRLDVRPCLSFDNAEVLVCTCVYQLCVHMTVLSCIHRCMYMCIHTCTDSLFPFLYPPPQGLQFIHSQCFTRLHSPAQTGRLRPVALHIILLQE